VFNKIRVVASVAALIVGSDATAQKKSAADTVTPRFTTGATYMSAGSLQLHFADLDSRLVAAGLPGAASTAASVGIGSDIRMGRLMLGASFQSLITRDQKDAAWRTRTGGSYALADVAVNILSISSQEDRRQCSCWSIYPIAGLGVTNISVSIREVGDFTFDQALGRPGRELGMSGLGGLAHGGLLVERRFHRGDAEYALALRAGMMKSLGSQRWRSDANSVGDGPSGLRATYVRIVFSRPMKSRRDAILPAAGSFVQTLLR
jgi:hypothetical protein